MNLDVTFEETNQEMQADFGETQVVTPGGTGEIPSALPNPHKLTFTGAVNAEYDGSKEVEVQIPAGGGGGAESSKWELLTTITTAEAVSAINISTTDSGVPFSEKNITELTAFLTIPAIPELTNPVKLVALFNDWHPMYTNAAGEYWLKNIETKARLHLKAMGRSALMWFDNTQWTQNSSMYAYECFNFTKLQLFPNTNTVQIPAGTVIQVYGR